MSGNDPLTGLTVAALQQLHASFDRVSLDPTLLNLIGINKLVDEPINRSENVTGKGICTYVS
jgi:hypothetical protein